MHTGFRVFLDSSALISGVISPLGGAQAIQTLADAGHLEIVISRQVQVECERNLRDKSPRSLAVYQDVLRAIHLEILPDPPIEQVVAMQTVIDPKDAAVLAAAMIAAPDYLVSLERKHFLQPEVAQRAGLRIGTPGDFLAWLRARTTSA